MFTLLFLGGIVASLVCIMLIVYGVSSAQLATWNKTYGQKSYYYSPRRPNPAEDAASWGLFWGIFLGGSGLLYLFILACSYFGSYSEVSKLQAFYNDTALSYQYTITNTNEIDIPAAQPGLIDVAHAGQAVAVSERMKELRDRVEWYNKNLTEIERCEENFFMRDFCAEPGDLKHIRITE